MQTNNIGFQVLNPPPDDQSNYCIVVVGIARGGTSAVAGSLASFGIYMGDDINSANHEDKKIISSIPGKAKGLLGSSAWGDFSAIAKEYAGAHQRWGFKYPSIHSHLFKINKLLTNPRYIFVYRDIFAISNRRSEIFSNDSQIESMQNCLRLYKNIMDFIRKEQPTSLLVSYEKMLTNTDAYVNTLSEFCGLSPTDEILKRTAELIMPSPAAYKNWSHNHKQAQELDTTSYRGRVHTADRKMITGWATNLKKDDPVTVEIYIDGNLHGRSLSDKNRPRLFEDGVTNSPRVGFKYYFSDNIPSADSVVKVIIAGANIEIINSGRSLREY